MHLSFSSIWYSWISDIQTHKPSTFYLVFHSLRDNHFYLSVLDLDRLYSNTSALYMHAVFPFDLLGHI